MLHMISMTTIEVVEESKTLNLKAEIDSINESIFGSIATLVGNILDIWPVLLFVLFCLTLLFTFKKRCNDINRRLLKTLTQNGKYIKGLFVELNDTKELLRYFTNGIRWKRRIVRDYNRLFNDEYGRMLRTICSKHGVGFSLSNKISIHEMYGEILKTLDLIQKMGSREFDAPEEYKETTHLLEMNSRYYIENLKCLKTRTEFAKNKYIILTGSAGNGKTNLLCSMTEMLMSTNNLCVFLNSKDVMKDMNQYFKDIMTMKNWKGFSIYWRIQMFILMLFNKQLYIVIDAINENEDADFMESLPQFINEMLNFRSIRIIVSCRSEYFDLKYKHFLVDSVESQACCYDLMKENYSAVAKDRIYENYKKSFRFQGEVSPEAKEKLYQQLLLMRMFFEVYKESSATIITLNKYEIFKRYIESVMGSEKNECNDFLDKVVDAMCRKKEYSVVNLSELNGEIGLSKKIKHFLDESILLSRKLVLHKDSIREKEEEQIYFVFDEMRDYCIAKHVLNEMCDSEDMPVEDEIMNYMNELVETKAVCTEGVINYIYWYFKSEGRESACRRILNGFVKEHDYAIEPYGMNRERGLNSWGLKIIFENSEPLMDYEKEYIKYIVLENPGEALSRMFEFLIHQELKNGIYNLELYFEALFEVHDVELFANVLIQTVASWEREGITKKDFIKIDKQLKQCNPEGCERFRIFVYLFIHLLQWENKHQIETYFQRNYDEKKIIQYLGSKIFFVENGDEDESES